MSIGTFGGGAPRFTIFDSTNNTANAAYVYFGTPQADGTFTDPNAGSANLNSTGNYANLLSTDVRVQVNGFGGDNTGAAYETWADFVATDGTVPVQFVTIDLDGGFTGNQQVLVNNFTVNADVDVAEVPEPSTWLTLMGGLGLFGVNAFRRRRRSLLQPRN